MAGDWIKMRGNLWDDPRIAKLCDITDCGEAQIIGGLYWIWATADQHTENGIMPGLTLRQIDRKTGIAGFGQAMCDIGWLADHPDGVRIIKFEEHNGQSAKRRASEAQRKANSRNVSAPNADKEQTQLGQDAELEKEKRREEIKIKEKSKAESLQRATRLPDDWVPSDELIEFCQQERPDLNHSEVAIRFRDYWIAQPGQKGRKTDWPATWRNWVRNEKAKARASPQQLGRDEKRQNFLDELTGNRTYEQRSDIIDIN